MNYVEQSTESRSWDSDKECVLSMYIPHPALNAQPLALQQMQIMWMCKVLERTALIEDISIK